jgi:peptide deformylase
MFGLKKKNIMNVRTYGDPTLKKKSEPIKEINHEIVSLAESLINTMYADDGVGLAAPQVGVNLRMFALGVPSARRGDGQLEVSPGEIELLPKMPLVFINPEIVEFGEVKEEREEGCLSVPDIYAPVIRPASVKFRAQILNGGMVEFQCGGLLARAIQHEYDHLDGKLFVDRLSSDVRAGIKHKLERLKKYGKKKGFLKRLTQ